MGGYVFWVCCRSGQKRRNMDPNYDKEASGKLGWGKTIIGSVENVSGRGLSASYIFIREVLRYGLLSHDPYLEGFISRKSK